MVGRLTILVGRLALMGICIGTVTAPAPVMLKRGHGQTHTETPFANRQRRESEHLDNAISSLQNDPNVASLSSAFNGQLDVSSVRPVHPIED